MLSRRTIVLKPMQAGLSGYARLQTEGGKTLLTLHARGMKPAEEVRLYRWLSGHAMQEAAAARANAHGEISAGTEDETAPDRLQALIVVSTESAPRPLLLGLLNGTLPEAKTAALSLCERLKKTPDPSGAANGKGIRQTKAEMPKTPHNEEKTPQAETEEAKPQNAGDMSSPVQTEGAKPQNAGFTTSPIQTEGAKPQNAGITTSPIQTEGAKPLPREVFLPAIDPAPYAQAAEETRTDVLFPPSKRSAPAVDRLRPLQWPRGFESLKPYFQKALPTALFDMPGWRFVYAAHAGGPGGLWLGIRRLDGRVCGVAYAHRGSASQRGFRPILGLDGQSYRIMIQNL